MSEVDVVAKAIDEAVQKWQPGSSQPIKGMAAQAAIAALDIYRAEEKRKNCKHPSKFGTGSVGGDGTIWSTWYCRDCGASYDSRTALVSPADGKTL